MDKTHSLVVIGGGPGGYPAAFHAADLGLNVTLIDTEPNPGGVCLYRGCIPSKALLHVAGLIRSAREADEFGISFGDVSVDVDKLRAWKEAIVQKLTGGLGQLRAARKVEFIQGRASFVDNGSLVVDGTDGTARTVPFGNAIVATGSKPATIPVAIDSPLVMDSTAALALEDVPSSLLVIGGGYIGLELGQVYAELGSKVSVVEMTGELLPGVDRDLAAPLVKTLQSQFTSVMLNTTVVGMKEAEGGLSVEFSGADVEVSKAVYAKVLVAVGRKPASDELGLEHTNVRVSDKGFIKVDSQRRTHEPAIFAIGDISGQPMLAHKATHEGRVAAEVVSGKKTIFDPRSIPAVVFTDPEIAWCGLTVEEARAKGMDVKVSKFPWAASGRAATLGRGDGLTKLIAEQGSGRVVGVGLAGHHAGELVAEATLAIEMGAVAEDLALTIHPHPTLSETIMEAAEGVDGKSTHFMGR